MKPVSGEWLVLYDIGQGPRYQLVGGWGAPELTDLPVERGGPVTPLFVAWDRSREKSERVTGWTDFVMVMRDGEFADIPQTVHGYPVEYVRHGSDIRVRIPHYDLAATLRPNY